MRLNPLALAALSLALAAPAAAQLQPLVPKALRGRVDAERSGQHDAANIRTVFWNYGMVGDYPVDPLNVDLSVFHSVEVPKGSGMDYSDGITPFVLDKITQTSGIDAYIMETGYRERQGFRPSNATQMMRFEPRPGWFEPDPTINKGRSPAISNDPRTWPSKWPDKLDDPADPGWHGSWDGYFGKRAAADQESFTVMDDDFYEAWDYYPDSRSCCTDSSRHGFGLRVEVRGFQWSNPQAANVIFWHYDVVNESTTDYDQIIFGLYMDSGVGGSAISCDGIAESDDDNAYWDKSYAGLNLVYTWDLYGHGVDLTSNCGVTGYLGYAYLETPGNPYDGIDNDNDGITDERRDSGPGVKIVGQDSILAYVQAHYDVAKFEAYYGPITQRPAYKAGVWWTGDEDMDWTAEFDDVGADGIPGTHDAGEGDGIPTDGEPDFDRTDKDESDQIGLTGFKMNRIKAGLNNNGPVDGIVFFTDQNNWPERLYDKFTDPYTPARFDSAVAANYNIAFLFASGPFALKAGKRERFSLALAYGADLTELRENVHTVQLIYNANYQFAVPPELPTATAEIGDGSVRLSWDDVAERSVDPVTSLFDFEGYRIYRSTDPEFQDPRTITNGRGTGPIGNGKPIMQFDLKDGIRGFSRKTIDGVAYWLGSETGITHTWTDTTATNGQDYFYAVCAYDFGYDPGPDSLAIYPSENAIAVSRTPRGGLILPRNVIEARPNARVAGFTGAAAAPALHVAGGGIGSVGVEVVNSNLISNHLFKLSFATPSPESLRARTYALTDSTTGQVLFTHGSDFNGLGAGSVGGGLLPVVSTTTETTVDPAHTGWAPGTLCTDTLTATYEPINGLADGGINTRRPGFPDSLTITFYDVVVDTGLPSFPFPGWPAKFKIIAHTAQGDMHMHFRWNEGLLNAPHDSTLDTPDENIEIVTYRLSDPTTPQPTWLINFKPAAGSPKPGRGEKWELRLKRPLSDDDVYTFTTTGPSVNASLAQSEAKQEPYVVPNPYIGSASFEPARFAVSGRGERRIEFRAIPLNATIRIYTVRGDLVQTLRQDGSAEGFVAWNLRTKDNLDVAPGLYIFQVEAPGAPTHTGKFALIK